jgi:hypothetical protein
LQLYGYYFPGLHAKNATHTLISQLMKIFAFIMAVFVLVLSCVPCMDEADIIQSKNVEAGLSTSHSSQQHHDTDPCSPFCTCNCCAGFTVFYTSLQTDQTVVAAAKFYSSYLTSPTLEMAMPVWQPPQLV